MVREEWAATADDVLWRRSKLGLRLDSRGRARLEAWLAGERRPQPATVDVEARA